MWMPLCKKKEYPPVHDKVSSAENTIGERLEELAQNDQIMRQIMVVSWPAEWVEKRGPG